MRVTQTLESSQVIADLQTHVGKINAYCFKPERNKERKKASLQNITAAKMQRELVEINRLHPLGESNMVSWKGKSKKLESPHYQHRSQKCKTCTK